MACPAVYWFMQRVVYPEESERWSLYTWSRVVLVSGIAVLGAWALLFVKDGAFWAAALATQLVGLILITVGVFVDGLHRRLCYMSLESTLLRAGSSLLGAGSLAALRREHVYGNLRGSILVQLLQTCTQGFAVVNMAVLLLVPVRQSALPALVDAAKALRRWYTFQHCRPKRLEVPDLAVEAPGSCNICLNDLCDDDTSEGLLRLACAHVFHSACIKGWLYRNESCPMCRKSATDLRRCTQIVHKPRKHVQPVHTLGVTGATMVTSLDGTQLGGDVSAARTQILSMVLPPPALKRNSASSSSSADSPRPQLGPRSSTLGAVSEAGDRSSSSGPVELRHHSYTKPHGRGAAARRSSSSLQSDAVAPVFENASTGSIPVPIQAWSLGGE